MRFSVCLKRPKWKWGIFIWGTWGLLFLPPTDQLHNVNMVWFLDKVFTPLLLSVILLQKIIPVALQQSVNFFMSSLIHSLWWKTGVIPEHWRLASPFLRGFLCSILLFEERKTLLYIWTLFFSPQAEMALLVMDEEEESKKHFNYNKIVEHQNLSKKKKKQLMKKKELLEDDFEVTSDKNHYSIKSWRWI